jgi:hypothetical protein
MAMDKETTRVMQRAKGKRQTFPAMRHWHFAFCILNVVVLASCSQPPTPIQVSRSGSGAYEAALATDENGFAVAWYDTRDGNPEIYLRLLDRSGHPSGPERRLTETPEASYEASLERIGDQFAVAWYEQTSDGKQTAMLGKWDRDGSRKWVQAIAPGSRNPVIATDGHAIVAAWIQAGPDGTESVYVGTWDEDGRESGTRARIGPASKTTWNLNLAVDRSGAWVVFDAVASTRASELFLGRLDSSGPHCVRLTRDDGAESKYPDLKISDEGRVALTWYDMRDGNDEVYFFVASQSDLHGEIDDRSRRVTMTEAESIGAYLAWNGGEVGLAWSDKTTGAHDVFFQRFDSAGMPLGSEERITRSTMWSLVPAVRPWGKGFALAWTEYQPTSSQVHEGTGEVAFTLVE